jgi:hypothetical protein
VPDIPRRTFVRSAAATAALLGAGCGRPLVGGGAAVPDPQSHPFAVGRRRCVALLDGTYAYRADAYFVNAPGDRVAAALARHRVPAPDRIPSPFTCLAVADDAGGWTLIDTGAGGFAAKVGAQAGRLHGNLVAAGIDPARCARWC